MTADSTNLHNEEINQETNTGSHPDNSAEPQGVADQPDTASDAAPARTRKPRRRRPTGHVAKATTPPAVAPAEVVDLPQAAGAAAPQVTVTAATRTRRPVQTEPTPEVVDETSSEDQADSVDDAAELENTVVDGPTTGVVGIHREAAQERVQQALDEGLEAVVGVIDLPHEDHDDAAESDDLAAAHEATDHDKKTTADDKAEPTDGPGSPEPAPRRGRTRRRRRRDGAVTDSDSAVPTGQGDRDRSEDSAGYDDSDVDAQDDSADSGTSSGNVSSEPSWMPSTGDWTNTSIFSAAIPQTIAAEDEPDLAAAAVSTDPFIAPPTDKLPPLPPKAAVEDDEADDAESRYDSGDEDDDDAGSKRRRRRRGGRGRRRRGEEENENDSTSSVAAAEDNDSDSDEDSEEAGSKRRRRRRRRTGSPAAEAPAEGRKSRGDRVTSVKGSTRLEAKRQRRREGRESGRRRPLISESQFLARREAVDRSLLVRQGNGRTQVAVLEDNVLVEHYVAQQSQTSMIGNVYLGRVQNVLPSMEAAFVDIGRGRNAVLYAGEVNWDAAGLEGQPRRIELALKSGDSVLVQVTKDPIGHKGARLTSQVTMPGRYLVYVPGGTVTGISQKLPESERTRLKKILKGIVPEGAGVIVRTAAEGATEAELTADIARLEKQWARIEKKRKSANLATALYTEPDLAIKMIRDVFNADFKELVISGDQAWETVQPYVTDLAPDLADRVRQWDGDGDIFDSLRVNEQISKALERKVWLPSGGSLVIDRTEAMTVIDVNTGKFTGQGGNLEATVTENNLEAAEEIIRQLRLRDIGGIVVIDFIDMVLESNRDLVLRRMLECLSRDRTRHQVAEVTSLGLVQMTRKRIGQGLLEAFSECCTACDGRGVIMRDLVAPLDPKTEAKPPKTTKQESKRRAVGAAAVARMAKAAKRTKNDDRAETSAAEHAEESVGSIESDPVVDVSASTGGTGSDRAASTDGAASSDSADSVGVSADADVMVAADKKPALSPMAAMQSSLAVQEGDQDAEEGVVAVPVGAAVASPRPARRRRSRRSSVTKVASDGSVLADLANDQGAVSAQDQAPVAEVEAAALVETESKDDSTSTKGDTA